MKLRDWRKQLIHPFANETEELKAIGQLFNIFNFSRQQLNKYILDPELVAAYTLFYGSTNYPKWEACMNRLPKPFIADLLQGDILEIGTGPGTFALAFKDWLAKNQRKFHHHWHGVDRSVLMLQQAKKLLQDSQFSFSQTMPLTCKRQQTLFFSHSLNEMEVTEALELINQAQFRNILWIEPGTRDFFEKSSLLREQLIKGGYLIITPCPNSLNCPARKEDREKASEWCHQVLRVSHPPCVERLCQKLKKDRRKLPISLHAYTLNKPLFPSQGATLFRFHKKTKHSFLWEVCVEQAGSLQLIMLEVSLRGLKSHMIKEIQNWQAGEKIELHRIEQLKPDYWRVEGKTTINGMTPPNSQE